MGKTIRGNKTADCYWAKRPFNRHGLSSDLSKKAGANKRLKRMTHKVGRQRAKQTTQT